MYESEGCVLVSSSGLLVGVVLQEETVLTASTWVGRGRRRLCRADLATAASSGQFLLATCGHDTPIAIYTITCSLNTQAGTVVAIPANLYTGTSCFDVLSLFLIIYWLWAWQMLHVPAQREGLSWNGINVEKLIFSRKKMFSSVFRIRIRILLASWIRIRIWNAGADPGSVKSPEIAGENEAKRQIIHHKKLIMCIKPVLWIRNFSLRIRIRLFNEFLLSKISGFGTDLFPDEIWFLKVLKWRFKT
jgi:hypothetical protein